MAAEKTAKKQRGCPFQPGQSGNPVGRPFGARNKTTLAAELLLDSEAEALSKKAVELALGGNVLALRLCLDRILPLRRERLRPCMLPPLQSATDVAGALTAIWGAVSEGEFSIAEAAELTRLVESFVSGLEVARRAARQEEAARIFPHLGS